MTLFVISKHLSPTRRSKELKSAAQKLVSMFRSLVKKPQIRTLSMTQFQISNVKPPTRQSKALGRAKKFIYINLPIKSPYLEFLFEIYSRSKLRMVCLVLTQLVPNKHSTPTMSIRKHCPLQLCAGLHASAGRATHQQIVMSVQRRLRTTPILE
jgi:hypothetical protein